MLSNSQPFPATYKWTLPDADSNLWSVTPQSGTLSGDSAEEVTVRWAPKPNAPHGESEVRFPHSLCPWHNYVVNMQYVHRAQTLDLLNKQHKATAPTDSPMLVTRHTTARYITP